MVSLDSLKLFRNEPLLKTLSKVLFFQFPNGPSCSPPSPNNVAFRFDSANVYIEVHSRLHKTFILRFSLFSTMRTKKEQSIDHKTYVLRTTCPKKAALHTCGDICTPHTRLTTPLSMDGCQMVEYLLKTRAGHLLSRARIVTGGSTPL